MLQEATIRAIIREHIELGQEGFQEGFVPLPRES